jgi:hypothetical protein
MKARRTRRNPPKWFCHLRCICRASSATAKPAGSGPPLRLVPAEREDAVVRSAAKEQKAATADDCGRRRVQRPGWTDLFPACPCARVIAIVGSHATVFRAHEDPDPPREGHRGRGVGGAAIARQLRPSHLSLLSSNRVLDTTTPRRITKARPASQTAVKQVMRRAVPATCPRSP